MNLRKTSRNDRNAEPGNWRPGDLLLFSGCHCLSWTIRIGTCSRFSHVGGLAYVDRTLIWRAVDGGWMTGLSEAQVDELACGFRAGWLLFESTTLVDSPCRITDQLIKGVQAHRPMSRITRYKGEVCCCGGRIRDGVCNRCGPRRYRDERASAAARGYDWQWRNFRLWYLSLPGNETCRRCAERGIDTPSRQVHHIKDLATHPELKYELSNLEPLCDSCHSKETKGRSGVATERLMHSSRGA